MAKGGNKKGASAKSKKKAKEGKTSKVSSAKANQDEELWDLVRTISGSESDDLQCSTDGCTSKVVIVCASKSEPEKHRNACKECQEEHFGGWPEGVELPVDPQEEDAKETKSDGTIEDDFQKAVKIEDEATSPTKTESETTETPSTSPSSVDKTLTDDIDGGATDTANVIVEESTEQEQANESREGDQSDEAKASADSDNEIDEEEEDDSDYNLVAILSEEKVKSDGVLCKICSEIPACVLYEGTDTKKRWYYCLNCQDEDFEGWPDKLEDFPNSQLPTSQHEGNLRKFCCAPGSSPSLIDRSIAPSGTVLSPKPDASHKNGGGSVCNDSNLTPVPRSQASSSSKKKSSAITPSPTPYDIPRKADQKKKSAGASEKTLKAHAQWLEKAKELGGSELVLGKAEAKKLIYDLLYDEMRPMEVDDIYKKLKGQVPGMILKKCLDEMAELNKEISFEDDDDEDDDEDGPKKAKSTKSDDPFSGSMRHKAAKGKGIYYVNHTKCKNGGDLDPDAYNEVQGKYQMSADEEKTLQSELRNLTTTAEKLEAEPTNEEAAQGIATLDMEVGKLRENVEGARGNLANEGRKKKLKKAIPKMAAEWRKRKRLHTEFLINIEEMSEGQVTMKKCKSGDGPIFMDTDEAVVSVAREAALRRRGGPAKMNSRRNFSSFQGKKTGGTDANGVTADPAFIGVTLDSQGNVKREYVSENAED
ncbi:expressed unknown protein [Seminavis robusta]|uniref:Uncharacterized protein n=1 Tax=Seminavis robusta TaxID=568900 RepID=A0A9N8E2M4_9STRA|nr:expressed unknown protein [Seminavis robusta]|eukprot:Sro587_g171310.1 n/a (705) ;mRNA; f:27717-30027